jgi:hypothetical protein
MPVSKRRTSSDGEPRRVKAGREIIGERRASADAQRFAATAGTWRLAELCRAMMYAFPILIALMLGYMFWLAAYRLRRDRVAEARLTRRPKRP